MTYVLQKKNLPMPDSLAGEPESQEDDLAAEQEVDDGRQWSGEPYEGDDAPQGPEGAYSVFTHPNGESAWLDRAEDRTLTGWVLAKDGTLYQYTDADAWATDVDGAGMAMVEGQGPTGDASMSDEASVEDTEANEQELEEAGMDPAAAVDPAADPAADPFATDGEDLEEDDEEDVDPAELGEFADELAPEGEEEDPDAEGEGEDSDYPEDDAEGDTGDEDETDDEDEDDEDNPVTRFTKGSEGKYLLRVITRK